MTNGANCDAIDGASLTPLHYAAFAGNGAIVARLLGRSVRIDQTDMYGWTPLHVAARAGAAEVVEQLVSHRARVSVVATTPRLSPHDLAAEIGAHDIVQRLAQEGSRRAAATPSRPSPAHDVCLSTSRLTCDGRSFRETDRLFGGGFGASEKGTEKFIEAVVRRDEYTCRACGLRAEQFQTALCTSGEPRDMDQWATFCTLCAACFQLDRVQRMECGVLIYLPEFRQADVSHAAREILVARITGRKNQPRASGVYRALERRAREASRRLGGEGTHHLARRLEHAVASGTRHELEPLLDGVRLLPLPRLVVRETALEFNRFPQMVAYWRSSKGPCSRVKEGVVPWLDTFEAQIQTDFDLGKE